MSLDFAKWKKKNPNKKADFKTYFKGESLTRQEFAKETDINRLVDKYTRTGRMPYDAEGLGIYVDVSELPDYKSAMDFYIHANESFQKLDVNVRKRFSNSPQELLDFLKDPANTEEGIKLGLIKAPEPQPDPAPAEPEATPEE